MVNAHLANFVEHNFQTRYDSTVQASNWLATQLDELKITVEKSEDSVVAYERENQIWAIDETQNITTQKLSDLNRELTVAQAERMRKEADYSLARSGKMDVIPAVRDSQVIQSLGVLVVQLGVLIQQALDHPAVAHRGDDIHLAGAGQAITSFLPYPISLSEGQFPV